jgi:hypothetical protein
MITDALAFDLRVYDPGAPVFASWKDRTNQNLGLDVVVTPSDPGWRGLPPYGEGGAYLDNTDNMHADGLGKVGTSNTNFQFVGQGAYVDIGYGFDRDFRVNYKTNPPPTGGPAFPTPVYADKYMSSVDPWFFSPRNITDPWGTPLTTGYAVYDTWSFHYENNGINEDGFYYDGKWHWYNPKIDPANGYPKWEQPVTPAVPEDWRKAVDQGVDGLDNDGFLGVDDLHERETRPAYDVPLRGMQVVIRSYERDSRAIRQVRVNQHFMQE